MTIQELIPVGIAEELLDPFAKQVLDLEDAARMLDVEPWIMQRLRRTERELAANLPIVRDDGSPATLLGMRVQHSTALGPSMGPLVVSSRAYLSEVKAAAVRSSVTSALLHLPLGGAAGALVCDAEEMSESELKQACKAYGHALRGVAARRSDVVAPGRGANEWGMSWIAAGIGGTRAVVGGLRELGGISGEEMNAWGVVMLAEDELRKQRLSLRGARVAVQGVGAVADDFQRRGATVIALADASGGVIRESGLDVGHVREHVSREGVLLGYPDAEAAGNEEVIESECDVLVLAAAERQVTLSNCDRVKARVVIEAVPEAVSRDAEKRLVGRGVVVIPDVVSGAGAVLAGFLEWSSENPAAVSVMRRRAALKKYLRQMESAMRAARVRFGCGIREGANLVAVERMAAAMRASN